MLRHAQIHNVVSQMPQKSDSAIFYKRKRCTAIFLIEFFPKNGGKHFALAWVLRAHPHFFEKILLKKLLCIVCVCKKWHCRFFEVFDLPPDNTFANLCLLKITLYPRVLSLEQNYSIYYYLMIFFWIELPSKPRFV